MQDKIYNLPCIHLNMLNQYLYIFLQKDKFLITDSSNMNIICGSNPELFYKVTNIMVAESGGSTPLVPKPATEHDLELVSCPISQPTSLRCTLITDEQIHSQRDFPVWQRNEFC